MNTPVPPDFSAVRDAIDGLAARLHFLREVGLGYLTLDRPFGTLSGGEAQRVQLATQLGLGLAGVTYILDEPSIGLHPRDTLKLIRTLEDLRDSGNSVLVVEHDEAMIRAADWLVELGPEAGANGGRILFEGTPEACQQAPESKTGRYLSAQERLCRNADRLKPKSGWVVVRGGREHNLKDCTARFPVGLLTCVCGISGSGKSTLVNELLAKAAAFKLNAAKDIPGRCDGVDGLEHFNRSVRVDQSPIGRSSRSNPATFTKLFDLLRDLFAQCPLAKQRGYSSSRFSFNVTGGRCERCSGEGQISLEREFLGDAHIECPSCRGARYNRETLDIRYRGLNIADVLNLTVSEALSFFSQMPKMVQKLQTLQSVGLGYIRLGQPADTLSGGEAQRIKLSLELSRTQSGKTLYLLDEPTTGLHWEDIQKLTDLLFALRDAGNTVILIEHHKDVLALADWMIEMGPGGGIHGGQVIYSGIPKPVEL